MVHREFGSGSERYNQLLRSEDTEDLSEHPCPIIANNIYV